MAARKEWTEWHLTPRGWERGATRVHGKGNTWIDDPADRVVSYVYQEIETSAAPTPRTSLEESWRIKETDLNGTSIDELIKKYGESPRIL